VRGLILAILIILGSWAVAIYFHSFYEPEQFDLGDSLSKNRGKLSFGVMVGVRLVYIGFIAPQGAMRKGTF